MHFYCFLLVYICYTRCRNSRYQRCYICASTYLYTVIQSTTTRFIDKKLLITNRLLLMLKSVEVDDDVALLLSCTVLGSMCTQVTLQSKLGGTGSAAVRTLWTCLWFCCGRMTRGSTFLGGSAIYTTRSLVRVSRSHGLMWHLRRFILMWSMNRFFGRPTDRCPDESSP